MKENQLLQLADLFTLFHDGFITSASKEGDWLILKIEIQYIAQYVNQDDLYFYLQISFVENLRFDTWCDQEFILYDIDQIVRLGLNIHSSETNEDNELIVHTSCDNRLEEKYFEGGKLIFRFDDFNILNQSERSISLSTLKDFSEKYWSDFGT